MITDPSLPAKLLALHPHAYQKVATALGLKRQHVRYVALGQRPSARVEKALRMAVARRRFP
jgi:hypothetical protein